jgi:hypothetical protein
VNIGSIQGGTNAGWRKVKQAPRPWDCCGHVRRAYIVRCPDCKSPRPN